MTEKEPIEHDDVVSSLLDLQRRLRDGEIGVDEPTGDGRAPTVVEAPPAGPAREDTVEVADRDLTILMTPVHEPEEPQARPRERFAPVTQLPTSSTGEDRVAALTERLGRLEEELSGVLGSLDSMHSTVAAEVTADVAARMVAVQHETDERTVRLVSDRMDDVKTRLTGELVEQRRDLAGLLERRMVDMETSLRDAIREAAGEPDPEEPEA